MAPVKKRVSPVRDPSALHRLSDHVGSHIQSKQGWHIRNRTVVRFFVAGTVGFFHRVRQGRLIGEHDWKIRTEALAAHGFAHLLGKRALVGFAQGGYADKLRVVPPTGPHRADECLFGLQTGRDQLDFRLEAIYAV